jgi:hypothetical protein
MKTVSIKKCPPKKAKSNALQERPVGGRESRGGRKGSRGYLVGRGGGVVPWLGGMSELGTGSEWGWLE